MADAGICKKNQIYDANLGAMSASENSGQIIATLVVGSDGSTAKDGTSRCLLYTSDAADE